MNHMFGEDKKPIFDHVMEMTITLKNGEKFVLHAHGLSPSESVPVADIKNGAVEVVACHFKNSDQRGLGRRFVEEQRRHGIEVDIHRGVAYNRTLERLAAVESRSQARGDRNTHRR